MKPIIKNALLIGGGAIVVSSLFGFKKYEKTKAIFDQMDIEPHSFSDLNVSFSRLKFKLDVVLKNNSNDDLFVTGSAFAVLKAIDVYYKNNFIATANVNINEISIPNKNQLIIRNIDVSANTVNVLQNIRSFLDFKIEHIGVIGIVEAFGTTYRIGEE